jgi:hypothetical protein
VAREQPIIMVDLNSSGWGTMFSEMPDKIARNEKGRAVFWYDKDIKLTPYEKYTIARQRLKNLDARRTEQIEARDASRVAAGAEFAADRKRANARQEYETLLKKDYRDWTPANRAAAIARERAEQAAVDARLSTHVASATGLLRVAGQSIEHSEERNQFKMSLGKQITIGAKRNRSIRLVRAHRARSVFFD